MEEHFVASWRQVFSLVGVVKLEPGNILGVAHALLMCVPLDDLQHDSRHSGLSSGPPAMTPISAVMALPLASAAPTAPPSPALFERLNPEQHASFPHVCERLPSHMRAVAFGLDDPGSNPLAVE